MENLKIHFLNTIWADSIILETSNNFCLIDTASAFYYPMIKKYLNDLKIEKLDFIILTHFHSDHYGNVKNILNDYQVNTLYLKHYYAIEGMSGTGEKANEELLKKEMDNYLDIINIAKINNTKVIYLDDILDNHLDIPFYNYILELYDTNNRLYNLYEDINSPYYHQKLFSENFNSIAVFVKTINHNIFLGADMTCSESDELLLRHISLKVLDEIYKRHNINHIDLYKSCHHGGGGTNSLILCEKLKAKYVIITNTAKWLDKYDTYDNLKQANKDVIILPTDHQKYVFNIGEDLSYETINEDSLFITLNKN